MCVGGGGVAGGEGSRVEMENEVVGQDRWAYIWKTLWHGFKAQSRGSKATLGEVVPGPKALLPLPQRRDSLLLAFPVLLIPEALSFYFVSKIKWNPTIGGRLPDCLLFGVKGLASRKGGGGGRSRTPSVPQPLSWRPQLLPWRS